MRSSTIRTRKASVRTTARPSRTTIRSQREDGEETKARIIEMAGQLFAERGFSEVTSKEICEAAGTNLTAVNYHFGSREGLYLRVLEEVHDHFSSPEIYAELTINGESARKGLARLMDKMVDNIYARNSWQMRLWARESVSPSQFAQEVMKERAVPKFEIMEGLLSELTGIPRDSVALSLCFLNVMAPFIVLLIMGRSDGAPEGKVLNLGPEKLAVYLKGMVFAGLDEFARKYAAGEIRCLDEQ